MVISTADISLLDTVIDGAEKISTVNGISVIAGYFVTDRNSLVSRMQFTMQPLSWATVPYMLRMRAINPKAKM